MATAMDKHHRDLVANLFATATEVIEDTHLVTTRGQSSQRTRVSQIQRAHTLRNAAGDLRALADAITAVISRSGRTR